VCAALVLGQLDAGVETTEDVRVAAGLLANHHRQVDVAHAHALNRDPTAVCLRGYVFHEASTVACRLSPVHCRLKPAVHRS
jgi:hypothetical protein